MIRLGIFPKLINGRRITDEKTLDITIMTYAGLINKTIVSNLQKNNCNSIGLSGVDCNLIKAKKRKINDIDYGLVGDIEKININFIGNPRIIFTVDIGDRQRFDNAVVLF